MIFFRYFIILITFFLTSVVVQAQTAMKAVELINQDQFAQAYNLIKSDGQYRRDPYLQYLLGLCYLYSDDSKSKARACFEVSLNAKENKGDNRIPNEVFYYIGLSMHYEGIYLKAMNYFGDYKNSQTDSNSPYYQHAAYMEKLCDYANQNYYNFILKNTTVKPLDFPLNSSYDDLYPIVPSISNQLMFTSNRRRDLHVVDFGQGIGFIPPEKQPIRHHIFQSLKNESNNLWDVQGDQINFEYDYIAPVSFSSDGNTLLILMGENHDACQLFIVNIKNGNWQTPEALPVNINKPDSNIRGASLVANGNQIFFSSNRAGGFGGYDLYWTYKIGSTWADPENLGEPINTSLDEITPYVSPNMEQLYFSSDGHKTFGYFDIFSATREGAGWTTPENIGFPINSTFNDICYTRSADSEKELFASDREIFIKNAAIGDTGNRSKSEDLVSNIYSHGKFDLYEISRIKKKMPLCIVSGEIVVTKDSKKVPFLLKVMNVSEKNYQPFVFEPQFPEDRYFMVIPGENSYTMDLIYCYDSVQRITPMNTVAKFPVYDTLRDFQFSIPKDSYQYEFNAQIEVKATNVFGKVIQKDVKGNSSDSDITNVEDVKLEDRLKVIRLDALVLIIDRITLSGKKELFDKFNSIEEKIEYEINSNSLETNPFFENLMLQVGTGFEKGDTTLWIGLTEVMKRKEGVNMKPKKISLTQNADVLFNGKNKMNNNGREALEKLSDWVKSEPEGKIELVYNGDIRSIKDQERIELITKVLKSNKVSASKITSYINDKYPTEKDRIIEFTLSR